MFSHKGFSRRTIAWAAVPILGMYAAAIPARAQSGSTGYVLLLASGFLCDANDASTCPAVVKSAQGDSYEMSGAGIFNPESKSVTATGTFRHRSADGNALETGIWIASELIRFNSYGIAPGALVRQGMVFGPPGFGPRRLPFLEASMPTGGLAVLRICLLPTWGPSKSATLEVNCALGKVPDEHPPEGIMLAFEGGGEFDLEPSGRTMFVSTRLAASPAPKPAAMGDQANPPAAPAQQ
jgi:hypothetical protein